MKNIAAYAYVTRGNTRFPYLKPALGALFAVLGILAAPLALAQSYPSQGVRLVVPFTAGTGMDTIARAVAPRLAERLGQSVVVQNVPGASGNIGTDQVAKGAADGYTLLVGANTMLMASQLYASVPFDPLKDFAPVSMAAYGTLMLVANPKTGIKSVADLLSTVRAKPGSVSYGSPGIGTPHHMAMELFKTQARLFMLHVPYRGTAGYTQDLLSGEVNVGFLPVHIAQGFVAAGRLNALAVGSAKRHPVAANVPTLEELGQKGVQVDMWYAFMAPARTPAPVVGRLNTEISAILKLPEIRDALGRAGLDAVSSTPDELGNVMKADYPRWGNVIRTNGIKAE